VLSKWEGDGTGSGSCPVMDFGVDSVEPRDKRGEFRLGLVCLPWGNKEL